MLYSSPLFTDGKISFLSSCNKSETGCAQTFQLLGWFSLYPALIPITAFTDSKQSTFDHGLTALEISHFPRGMLPKKKKKASVLILSNDMKLGSLLPLLGKINDSSWNTAFYVGRSRWGRWKGWGTNTQKQPELEVDVPESGPCAAPYSLGALGFILSHLSP